MKKVLFICTLLLLNFISFAQDTLFLKNNNIVSCKITEVRTNEITYKDYDNLEGPNIFIPISSISKIKYSNGKIVDLIAAKIEKGNDIKVIDKKDAIKFIFFSPLFENLGFVYERKLKMGQNLEIRAGYIGIGNTLSELLGNKNTIGFYVCGGIKFIVGQKSQEHYIDDIKYLHPLKGKYIKPELVYSTINYSVEDYYYPNTTKINYQKSLYGINIIFGKQYIFGKSVTFDPYIGFGYGLVTSKTISGTIHNDYQSEFNFGSDLLLTEDFPIMITGGFTFGYVFK